jgi:excisionase family DNA binding protein
MEKIYTIKDVAEMTDLTELTIKRKIRSGDIPHVRLNGSNVIRITESQLQDWLDKKKETANRDASSYKRKKQPKNKNTACVAMLDLVLT